MTQQRWTADIVGHEQPPQIAITPQPGRLDIDPNRRGLMIYEFDWQRMLKLSAAEALQLLAFLQDNRAVLQHMADEDAQALLDAQRRDLERVWRAS